MSKRFENNEEYMAHVQKCLALKPGDIVHVKNEQHDKDFMGVFMAFNAPTFYVSHLDEDGDGCTVRAFPEDIYFD